MSVVRHGLHDLRYEPRGRRLPPRPDPQVGEPPLAGASIKALNHSFARTLETHLGETVNVKGMGALGNGSADDTQKIQDAIDLAFGPTDNPHGYGGGELANKPLYLPAGDYKVSAPAAMTVLGAASAPTGNNIKLTVNSTANYKTGQLCYVIGLNGVTNNGNSMVAGANYGIQVNDLTHITLRSTVYGGTWTSGGTITRAALQIHNVTGGRIVGAGREACRITVTTPNSSVLAINGMARSHIEGIDFAATGTGTAVDFDFDFAHVSRGDDASTQSTQSNLFVSVGFTSGAYGIRCGLHGQQVSENTFLNCFWAGSSVAGLYISNYNALSMSVMGGNIQGCGIGIFVWAGSCPIIHGVGFQNQVDADIAVENSAGDGYSITACRSETSLNNTTFVRVHAGPPTVIACCTQIGTARTGAIFAFCEVGLPPSGTGAMIIDACYSDAGRIAGNGTVYIRGNAGGIAFSNTGYLSGFGGVVAQNI